MELLLLRLGGRRPIGIGRGLLGQVLSSSRVGTSGMASPMASMVSADCVVATLVLPCCVCACRLFHGSVLGGIPAATLRLTTRPLRLGAQPIRL